MEIRSGAGYPASALSNFAAHFFVFDGVECGSMEGLLQALKFDKPHVQANVCRMTGMAAKIRGKKRNKAWQSKQTLWWKGAAYDRHGAEYQALLDSAYGALADQNEGFRRALLATGKSVFTHALGSSKESETVLTAREFCSRLHAIRNRITKPCDPPTRKTK
jgi:predicted NAD-dependent protein-ADP-ribosyltransferase YbiA (DUF1768 family)